MMDKDVEKTLVELRQRVKAQIRPQSVPDLLRTRSEAGSGRGDAGAIESLKANISVIERSWNRLPPIISYRSGWLSRLELWLKRCLKRATHWFTWEQVNFNSATYNSFKDILALLSLHQQLFDRVQKQAGSSEHSSTTFVAEHDDTAGPTELFRDIDVEIDNLAARIEQLRELKTRVASSNNSSTR